MTPSKVRARDWGDSIVWDSDQAVLESCCGRKDLDSISTVTGTWAELDALLVWIVNT